LGDSGIWEGEMKSVVEHGMKGTIGREKEDQREDETRVWVRE
jgi:hypothetical protein